jgi:hypothetical protein
LFITCDLLAFTTGGTVLNLISAPLSLPRAHLDPIISSQDILAVLSLAIRRPLCNEVMAILMDEEQRGIGLLSFDEPHSPTSLIHQLIGLCSTTAIATSVIIASVRPRELWKVDDQTQLNFMRQQFTNAGITLREWIVISKGAVRLVQE